MRTVALAGIITFVASTSFAQNGTSPVPTADAPANARQPAPGGPANICQELVAFMKAPPASAASAKPGSSQTRGQGGAAKQDATSPSDKGVRQKSHDETRSAQDASGQSGPAHGAPSQNPAAESETGAHKAELKSGLSAPVPVGSGSPPKDSVLTVAEAEDLASANDIQACQDASRKLRLAGVAMPPPLLALTALDLRYQQKKAPK